MAALAFVFKEEVKQEKCYLWYGQVRLNFDTILNFPLNIGLRKMKIVQKIYDHQKVAKGVYSIILYNCLIHIANLSEAKTMKKSAY